MLKQEAGNEISPLHSNPEMILYETLLAGFSIMTGSLCASPDSFGRCAFAREA